MKIYHNGQVLDLACTIYEPFLRKEEPAMINPDDDTNDEISNNSGTDEQEPTPEPETDSDEVDINSGT